MTTDPGAHPTDTDGAGSTRSPAPHVVVVGAGLAGLRTVERLRRLGHTGRLTLVGAEQVAAYDRPPLSKLALAGVDEPEPAYLRAPEKYDELDVDLRLGATAAGLDPAARELRLDDGSVIAYDELVVATGARAREVPAWSSVPGVHVLRTFDDLVRVRAAMADASSLAVVGAGVLGCEIAATARSRGLEVHLVDVADRPLARIAPPLVGQVVADLHAERGVRLHLASGIDSIEEGPDLRLSDGTALDCDLAVVAIGSAPATEWLAGSGIEVEDGVVVDTTGATSAPHVWAVGDVAAVPHPSGTGRVRLEHWTAAGETASRVAAHVLGQQPTLPVDVPYVWSDQYDLKLQTLGLPAPDDDLAVVAGALEERRFLAVLSRDGTVTGAVAMGMPAAVARCRSAVADGEDLSTLLERAPWERRKVSS